MRLAARSREQDKLELELPGLRAGVFLLARISVAIGNTPNSGKIFKEFEARGFETRQRSLILCSKLLIRFPRPWTS